MKELKQVEYPDIQLIAEGTGKILRFGNRANQEKLGPRRAKNTQGPESRPEINSFKKAYRGISQTTKPLNGSHDSGRTQTRKTNRRKIKTSNMPSRMNKNRPEFLENRHCPKTSKTFKNHAYKT